MANMQIKTSTGDLEDYRFIYHEEELPSIHFQPHTIDSKTLFWLLLVIIASVLALLVCTYACSRKILPMLGILKNRVLI